MIALFSGNLPPITPREPTVSLSAALTAGVILGCAVVSALVAAWVLL